MQSHHRVPQSKRWCFTVNNYDPLDEESLRLLGLSCKYLIFGREVSSTGTPHLQGFVLFETNYRFAAVVALFPNGTHLEVAKAASHTAAAYCKKDHDFEEFGSCPAAPGKTNRYDDFRDWVITFGRRPTMAEVAAEWPSIFLQSGRVQLFIDFIYPQLQEPPGEYRPYQESLATLLSSPDPDSRKILFVVDPVGNSGKSWFVDTYYRSRPDDVQILSVGKREDLSYAIDDRKRVFLFDLPRSACEFLPYVLLEQLKDRRVFSNKYESRMKMLINPTHVVVFTNEYPDMTKLSADRYEIIVWNNSN